MKNLSITRILLTILVCMTGVSAYADFSVENADGVAIRYRYINDNYDVVVANDNNFRNLYSGNLVIPEEIIHNDITSKVVAIDSHAFYLCPDLTSVTIPESVTSIGSSAFAGCSNLTTIIGGDNITSIGFSAFHDCSSLTSVPVTDKVTFIDRYAFQNCSSLTSVIIPSGLTELADGVFWECSSLTADHP